ncbi:MAG: hypothetical protein EAZ92_13210 [Candidatus Kapaibacterium sp.]|nr:MAG: hypothetical protein EAZ92_13210 [Candidatus Kapabacteria bacterium]
MGDKSLTFLLIYATKPDAVMNATSISRLIVSMSIFLGMFHVVCVENLRGQVYVDGGNTRHRFAQMYFSAEGMFRPNGMGTAQRIGKEGNVESVPMQGSVVPRLTIGGMHFWGHADFFVTFNLASQSSQTQGLQHGYQFGVETGARVYPWRVEKNALRPFLGISWSSGNYSQAETEQGASGAGAGVRVDRALLSAGLAYQIDNIILEGGAKFVPDSRIDYWISRTQKAEIALPNAAFWLGAKYVFDTTIGEEVREQKRPGYLKQREEVYREENRLNTWTVAAGPSSAWALASSPYTLEKYPFANAQMSANNLALDFSVGYLLYDADVQMNVSYRPMTGSHSAYGIRQSFQRHAFALEAFKFIGDYHGFAPYIGATLGAEAREYKETEGGTVRVLEQQTRVVPGIIAGWDIRPTKTDAWLLRTNVRYTPFTSVGVSGSTVILPNLEVNFIQLVINLNRFFQ